MFKRLLVEEWQNTAQVVSFLLFLAVFVAIVIRAYRMPKDSVKHLENLPLEKDANEPR